MDPLPIFVVVGAGGVGGLLGGLLARAGFRVQFLVRGRTRDAMNLHGLRVRSPHGDFTIERPELIASSLECARGTIVLLAVKGYNFAEACESLRPAADRFAYLLPLLNGAFAVEDAIAIFGRQRVLGGLCRMVSESVEPGVIVHRALGPIVEIQALETSQAVAVDAIANAMRKAQITATLVPDIRVALWEKLAFVASLGLTCASASAPAGAVRDTPEKLQIIAGLVAEILQIGRACGAPIAHTSNSSTLDAILRLAPESMPSLSRDILAGRVSELDWQAGRLLPFAASLGVATPLLREYYLKCGGKAV